MPQLKKETRLQIPPLSHSRKAKSLIGVGWICWGVNIGELLVAYCLHVVPISGLWYPGVSPKHIRLFPGNMTPVPCDMPELDYVTLSVVSVSGPSGQVKVYHL